MIVISDRATAEDLASAPSWAAVAVRGARSWWSYERVLQAAREDAVLVTDETVFVDGRLCEPAEFRAASWFVRSGMAELVPSEDPGADRLVLSEDGRAQLARWARYTPLGGGEQA